MAFSGPFSLEPHPIRSVDRVRFRLRDLLAVREQAKSLAFAESAARLIPDHCHDVPVIRNVVQAEPVPCACGNQRVDLHYVVRARPQAGEASDRQVAVARVIVVIAPAIETLLAGIFMARASYRTRRCRRIPDPRRSRELREQILQLQMLALV